MSLSVIQLLNDEAICRIAPATLGLLLSVVCLQIGGLDLYPFRLGQSDYN